MTRPNVEGRPTAGTCSSCKADILWITLLKLEGGSPHPVDPEPVEDPEVGLIAVRRTEMVGLTGLVLSSERMRSRLPEFRAKGAKWYRSHFATCPQAETHRRNPDQLGLL